MKSAYRLLALFAGALVLLLGVAACGGMSKNSVISIGGDEIKQTEFDHFMPIAANQSAMQGGQAAVIPDPPKFEKCIAALKKNAPKPSKDQPRPTDATYKAQCEQNFKQMKDQVLQYLIRAAWIQGEAADRGIKVSDKEVKKEFSAQRKQNFPTVEAYEKFLKSSGYTTEDLLFQVKSSILSERLQKAITKGTDKVSEDEIKKYYEKNKKNFSQPEQRSMLIIMTKTRAKAEEAKRALIAGRPWKDVAKTFSIDVSTKATGGKLDNVPEGQQERTLDRATFKAKRGVITGPIKTPFGYYVFRVTKVTPASQQSLAEVRDMVKQTVQGEKQQKALQNFSKAFEKKWKARTECREGYTTEMCQNAPKPKTTTSTTQTTKE